MNGVIGHDSRSYHLLTGNQRGRKLDVHFPYNLEAMRNVDIRTVDPATLADIRDININTDLPFNERVLDFIRQSKGNAYCFRCNGVIVKIVHSKNAATLNDCMEGFFQSL